MSSPTQLNPDARTECVDMLLEIMGYPRDELFEYPNRADDSREYIARSERTLDKILAVAKPEVNTVEELDALPLTSVVRTHNGWVYELRGFGWVATGLSDAVAHIDVLDFFPARVLYRPEVKP